MFTLNPWCNMVARLELYKYDEIGDGSGTHVLQSLPGHREESQPGEILQ